MRIKAQKIFRNENAAKNAWIMFGGLIALGLLAMTVREVPAMRRELKLLRM
jgi:hypothetical protein